MHRVELKGNKDLDGSVVRYFAVPNAPCGVESFMISY